VKGVRRDPSNPAPVAPRTGRRTWTCRRAGPGRPGLGPEAVELITRLARENPRSGYLRIRGELLKLGVRVSATAIRTVLRREGLGPAPRRSGPSWSQFLRAQARGYRGVRLDRARVQAGPRPRRHQEPEVCLGDPAGRNVAVGERLGGIQVLIRDRDSKVLTSVRRGVPD